MGLFVKGDIVVIPFPFSDLSGSKRRPALVIADLKGDDIILCQITSKNTGDNYAIPIDIIHFKESSLQVPSNIRPNRIFTADKNIIVYKLTSFNYELMQIVINKIIQIISK
jgi:mRNA interferase MazF